MKNLNSLTRAELIDMIEVMDDSLQTLTTTDDSDYIRVEPEYQNVTRVEVIDSTGRAYVKHGVNQVEFSRQDQGRTLKIFLTDP